jgi:hypothetical protein
MILLRVMFAPKQTTAPLAGTARYSSLSEHGSSAIEKMLENDVTPVDAGKEDRSTAFVGGRASQVLRIATLEGRIRDVLSL